MRARKEGNTEIRPFELMSTWVYEEKFLTSIQFLSGMLSFTVVKDDDLERSTQE
jgi:hypothetical protein